MSVAVTTNVAAARRALDALRAAKDSPLEIQALRAVAAAAHLPTLIDDLEHAQRRIDGAVALIRRASPDVDAAGLVVLLHDVLLTLESSNSTTAVVRR
jgi:hypothetical protein